MFKFSVICNILPYYGKLVKWELLMTAISKDTRDLWRNNYDAFLNWGERYRSDFNLDITAFDRNKIIKIGGKYQFIDKIYIDKAKLNYFILELISSQKNNIAVFAQKHNFEKSLI